MGATRCISPLSRRQALRYFNAIKILNEAKLYEKTFGVFTFCDDVNRGMLPSSSSGCAMGKARWCSSHTGGERPWNASVWEGRVEGVE